MQDFRWQTGNPALTVGTYPSWPCFYYHFELKLHRGVTHG